MRRRLYFILPDSKMAEKIEHELLLSKIDESHIHFHSTMEANLGELPKANLFQKTDLIHGMGVGLVVGGLTGAAVGFIVSSLPELGIALGQAPILGLAILGAVFGTWVSGMIAVSCPNSRLKSFQKSIDKGHILLMIDVPKERVSEINEMIRNHHPEVDEKGIEPTIPAFP
jgi:uncharacterized membrane protein